ncbi:hypothetical protein KAR91_44770 [Candidatus Pacearchaeota archaeon]|nr:hypothetical protein [Candidatus Pacearchaeota archaeon]
MPSTESDKEWEARQDMDTLIDAEKIKKSPKRLKAALLQAKKQKEALSTLEKGAKE